MVCRNFILPETCKPCLFLSTFQFAKLILPYRGVDAKTLSGILGHTNASFTLDTYTHVTLDMQKAASDVVGGFLKDLLGEELNPWQGNEKAEPAP